jgi:hypothetical protein
MPCHLFAPMLPCAMLLTCHGLILPVIDPNKYLGSCKTAQCMLDHHVLGILGIWVHVGYFCPGFGTCESEAVTLSMCTDFEVRTSK